MTPTGGGPAVRGASPGVPAGAGDRSRVTARSRARRLRVVLGLARVEASLLVRSLLVLAGLLAGGAVVWVVFGSAEPLWWNAAWRIGFGQLVLGMSVLAAAQLAAGRPRRDGMADLYASFPATAGTRSAAHLAGLVGAAPASLLLIAAAAVVVQVRGAIGAPSITVLAGGLLLVVAAGAAGIAIGTRFPHPLAGVLGALVLFLSSATSHLGSGGSIWLLPWEWTQDQLGSLPGPLAGYPPAGAHVLELAGLAVLAGLVALAVTVGRARARVRVVGSGAARPWWLVLSFAGRLILLHHTGRNAAALTDRQAVLLRPGPDITGALPTGRGPARPARLCSPRIAGVLYIGCELLAECGGVLGIQVDLIVGALEGKPHRLLGRAAGQIVFQRDGHFLGHLTLPSCDGACTLHRPASPATTATPQIRAQS